jgi:hypothetical protein
MLSLSRSKKGVRLWRTDNKFSLLGSTSDPMPSFSTWWWRREVAARV